MCAVIIEGIQGIGGIQVPKIDFMQQLREVCTQNGVVLILDEIQSGYGRSGKFFAHQYAGIKADLITMAKGIGCAAAIAVLDIMKKENLVENAANTGNYLINELKKIPQIKEVRGEGLMIGLEFDQPVKEIRSKLLFEQKVFTGVSGTNVIRLLPPLVLTTDQADIFIERLKKVLN